MKFAITLVLGLAALAASAPTVDDKISKTLAAEGTVTVIVTMANSQHRALRSAFVATKSRYTTRDATLNAFYSLMKGHADEVQGPVLSLLDDLMVVNAEMRVEQSWVTNQIIIRGANAATIDMLRTRSDIAEIAHEQWIPLDAPRDLEVYENGAPKAGEPWGIRDIEADKIWASGNSGAGVVVANIDTGVRYTHEILRAGWRQEYGWYDPSAKSVAPNDGNGHGTHTMGTIAGKNGYGVAPEAQWVACKGCTTSSCSNADLTSCGNWVTCPTDTDGKNPDCTKAPKVSSNSWSGGGGQTWFNDIVDAWIAVNIAPLFSSANSGPSCRTVGSPADYVNAIAVGSTVEGGGLSSFSSVGPANSGIVKPDVAAPGSNVLSAYNTGDMAYATLSGTSMACPHVAGLAGLLYSQRPNLTVAQLREALIKGAGPHTPTGRNCGGIEETVFPNNAVGYGRINAVRSLA